MTITNVELNVKDIVKQYNAGKSTNELAKEFGTYTNKIRRLLEKEGIKLRGKSESQKLALESGKATHPTKGKERPESFKKAISDKQFEHWSNLSDEEYEERRRLSKENFDKMSPSEKKNFQRKGTLAVRKTADEGSKLEKFLKDGLFEAGYLVEHHKENLLHNQKQHVDLYIASENLIVEVDGATHRKAVFSQKQLENVQMSDLTKNGAFLSRKFNIIRIKHPTNISKKRFELILEELIKTIRELKDKKGQLKTISLQERKK